MHSSVPFSATMGLDLLRALELQQAWGPSGSPWSQIKKLSCKGLDLLLAPARWLMGVQGASVSGLE